MNIKISTKKMKSFIFVLFFPFFLIFLQGQTQVVKKEISYQQVEFKKQSVLIFSVELQLIQTAQLEDEIFRRIRKGEDRFQAGLRRLKEELKVKAHTPEFLIPELSEKYKGFGLSQEDIRTMIASLEEEIGEYFEIINPDGSLTGKVVRRDISHQRGYLHHSVIVGIFDSDGKLLGQVRSQEKDIFPGAITFSACGHSAVGEMPLETAVREGKEETGLTIDSSRLVRIGDEVEHYIFLKQYIFSREGDHTEIFNRMTDNLSNLDLPDGITFNTPEGIIMDSNYNKATDTTYIYIYTFNEEKAENLERLKATFEDNFLRGWDMEEIFNRELKTFYVYILTPEEEALINAESEEVDRFIPYDLNELIADFYAHPVRYTDAFIPFFIEDWIIEQIKEEVGF